MPVQGDVYAAARAHKQPDQPLPSRAVVEVALGKGEEAWRRQVFACDDGKAPYKSLHVTRPSEGEGIAPR
ncbi:hypothetical protein RTBOTA2_003203 [Rhodotorula toruloides]|nr:hypothetical protein RTBOTA2_003203 [Rhodotorula toruloides]